MSYKTINFAIDEQGIASLCLNRPDSLNALSVEMLHEIMAAVQSVAMDATVRVLVLSAAGRAFCSGADLTTGSDLSKPVDAGQALIQYYNPLITELVHLKVPVICAVNGVAAGAGMSLALVADFTIASQAAYFLQAFVNIGLVPDAGSSFILPHLIGNARAKRLAMLGEKLPAKSALDWGMIYDVVDDDQLQAETQALALRLAKGPTKTLGAIKQLINQASHASLSDQMVYEAEAQRVMGKTDDFIEGVTAFIEKRPAAFKGH